MNMINSGQVSALWCCLTFLLGTATISVANANDCLDVTTVEEFDLETYASRPWYVQQQAENLYTPRDLDRCAKAEYSIRDTRTFWGYSIDVMNSAETGSGDRGATLCADYDPQQPSALQVAPCFVPKWFAGPYWVVAYNDDTDNGYALVSGGQPRYAVDNDTTCGNNGNEQCCKTGSGINNSGLWILTRQTNPSSELVEEVRSIARQKGFSTTPEVLFDVEQTDCGYDDIPATAIANGSFTTLVAALEIADLVEVLSQPNGDLTVFAPTDDAFAALPRGLIECLLNDTPTLANILTYHVAIGKFLSKDLSNGEQILTLFDGQSVTVDLNDGVKINESVVVFPDIAASNGVIHAIDKVLVPESIDVEAYLELCDPNPSPPPLCENEYLTFKYKGRMKACKWVKKQLNRQGLEFCNKKIGPRNNKVHIKELCPVTCGACLLDIPGTAIANGSFKTLVAALIQAELVEPLSEPNGVFTVFAPNDDAFAKLPNGLVGCLLKDKYKDVLTELLSYHVVSGKNLSKDLSDGQQIQTILDDGGQVVTADLENGVKINDSIVIAADVAASNGVIHVIDKVMVPSTINVTAFLGVCTLEDIPTTAVNAGIFKTLVAALDATDLVTAIAKSAGTFTVLAPRDEAFVALPDDLLNCLLNDIPTLSNILLYHVTNGKVLSKDLTDGLEIAMLLEGQSVTVELSDGNVKMNAATVVEADVETTNGVIHVIDQVLVPANVDIGAYLTTCDATPIIPSCEDVTDKWEYKPLKMRSCKWVQKKLRKKGITFCDKSIGNNDNKLHVKDHCPVTCGTCVLN